METKAVEKGEMEEEIKIEETTLTKERFIELVNKDPELEKYADSLFHEFIFQETNEKFMGFNFATASREICIYDYIPPQWIYSVLERIHIDLILIQRFNEEYISLSKEDQKKELMDSLLDERNFLPICKCLRGYEYTCFQFAWFLWKLLCIL